MSMIHRYRTTRSRRHLCLLDGTCWAEWWRYGMPMRYYGKQWRVTILSGKWRRRRMERLDP